MRRITLLILLFVGIGMQAQQLHFTIEVRHPAQLSSPLLSNPVGSVLLVNNATTQPADFGHQNKMDGIGTGSTPVDLSNAARMMLFGLESSLFDQEVFEDVQVLDISQNTTGNFYRKTPLTPGKADSLCLLYGTDAILSLNQVVVYDLQEVFLTDNDTYYAYLQAFCSSQWTVQYKGRSSQYTLSTTDTLVWEQEHFQLQEALGALPTREEALEALVYYSGQEFGKRLFPQWTADDRYLYTTKDERFAEAILLVRKQRWQEAHDAFEAIFRNSRLDALTRASAAADAAVCAEMLDDKKKAVAWIEQGEPVWLALKTAYARQQVVNLRYYKQKLTAPSAK